MSALCTSFHYIKALHLAFHRVGIWLQVLLPAHLGIVCDQWLLGHFRYTHASGKLRGPFSCQTRVFGLQRKDRHYLYYYFNYFECKVLSNHLKTAFDVSKKHLIAFSLVFPSYFVSNTFCFLILVTVDYSKTSHGGYVQYLGICYAF